MIEDNDEKIASFIARKKALITEAIAFQQQAFLKHILQGKPDYITVSVRNGVIMGLYLGLAILQGIPLEGNYEGIFQREGNKKS